MALENFREAQVTYTDSGASEVLAAKPAIEKQNISLCYLELRSTMQEEDMAFADTS